MQGWTGGKTGARVSIVGARLVAAALASACLVQCTSGGMPAGEATGRESSAITANVDGSCVGSISYDTSGPPTGWSTTSISATSASSSVNYDSATGSFVVTASEKGLRRSQDTVGHCVQPLGSFTGPVPNCDGSCGTNVCMPDWDGARFVYQTVSSDAEIIARVACSNDVPGAQIGVMIRETSATDPTLGSTPYARMDAAFVRRRVNGGSSGTACAITSGQTSQEASQFSTQADEFNEFWTSNRVRHPATDYPVVFGDGGVLRAMPGTLWFRLQRVGSNISLSRSRDGVSWTIFGGGEFPTGTAQIGFFAAGGEQGQASPATSVFDHVTVRTPQLPYATTWIGSSNAQLSTDFVSFGMHDMYVAPDGTVFKYSQAAEQGHNLNIIGSDGTLTNAQVPGNGFIGFYQGGIAGDGSKLYLGVRPGFTDGGADCGATPTRIQRRTLGLALDTSTPFSYDLPGVLGGLAAANGKIYASTVSLNDPQESGPRMVPYTNGVGSTQACPGAPSLSSAVHVLIPPSGSGQWSDLPLPITRPGPLAVQVAASQNDAEQVGRIWVVQGATEYPALQMPASGGVQEISRFGVIPGRTKPNEFDFRYPGSVRCFERKAASSFGPCVDDQSHDMVVDATLLGYSSGTAFSPMGVAIDPGASATDPSDDRLIIADNGPKQRVVICSVSPHVTCSTFLGADGGVFAGPTPGLVADSGGVPRFFSPLTVGVDSARNIYVASSAPHVYIRKFTSAGAPVSAFTPVAGLGEAPGGFDPGTDGQDFYTAAHHYVFHTDHHGPGSEWELKSITWNPFAASSNASRYFDGLYSGVLAGHTGGGIQMRRVGTTPFMFRSAHDTDWEILRFDGEQAVACGSIKLTSSGLSFWSDANGDGVGDGTVDGVVDSSEVHVVAPSAWSGWAGWTGMSIDRDGNLWFGNASNAPGMFEVPVSVQNGVIVYDTANPQHFALPQTQIAAGDGRYVLYQRDQDALYVWGGKASTQTYSWLGGAWCTPNACPCTSGTAPQGIWFVTVERYSGWLYGSGQTSAPDYSLVMPEQRANPTTDDDFNARYADPECHCSDFHWVNFQVAGDLMFVQGNQDGVRVFPNRSPGNGQSPVQLAKLFAGPELAGFQWWTGQSIMQITHRTGEYLVTTNDDSNNARTLAFRLPDPTWSPAVLSPLAWYTATDSDVTQASGLVSAWADHSGHGLSVSNDVAGGKPTYHVASWNSKPTVTFSGNQLLRRTNWSGIPGGTDQPFSVLGVLRSNQAQNGCPAAWWSNIGSNAARCCVLNVSGATRPNLARDGDWGTESLTPTVDLGTNPHVIVWRFTPNGSGGYSLTVDVDGTHYPSTTSSQTGPVSFTHLLIGARSDLPTWQFVGDISEIVVVPAYVSDADVGSYYAYAQTTWGVP